MPAGRKGWSGGEVCSGSTITAPVPRRLVSANFENASRTRDFGSVRIFGHDEIRIQPRVRKASWTTGDRS